MAALLWAVSALPLGACGESGVRATLSWLRQNNSGLTDVVNRLRDSGIMRVQARKYADAAKYYPSERDESVYQELRQFMDRDGIISIEVTREQRVEARPLKGITFHVREISTFDGLSEVSVVYAEPGVNPDDFFREPACKSTDSELWFLCEWKPR